MAAYRRPDFRVDATLTSATPFAGTSLDGHRHRPLPVRRADEGPRRCAGPTRARAAYGAPSSLTQQLPARGLRLRRDGRTTTARTELRADEDADSTPRAASRSSSTTTGGDGVPLRVPARRRGHRRLAAAHRQPRLVPRASRAAVTSASSCPTSSISRPGVNADARGADAGRRATSRTPTSPSPCSTCSGSARAAPRAAASTPGRPRRRSPTSARGTRSRGREPVHAAAAADGRRLLQAARRGEGRRGPARRRPRPSSTRSAPATRRGRATTTTASTWCRSRRPTARRDGADHDQVAVGTGDRAASRPSAKACARTSASR